MLVVAFSPSLWAATLRTMRDLTRVAVTALVLIAGGPASAGPAAPADGGSRTVATSRAAAAPADLEIDGAVCLAPVGAAGAGLTGTRASGTGPAARRRASVAGNAVAVPPASVAGNAVAVPPASGVPAHLPDTASAAPRAGLAVAATDPARDALPRRGPPRI